MDKVTKAKLAGVFISLMALAFGAFFIVYCLRQWSRGRASARWPEAEGVITFSQMRHGRYSSRNNEWTLISTVRYEFEVGGARYVSERVSFGALQSDRDRNWQVWNYPEGRRVSVYYDPADPRRSVLEPGVQGGVYKGLAIGGVCAIIGCVLMYATLVLGFGVPAGR